MSDKKKHYRIRAKVFPMFYFLLLTALIMGPLLLSKGYIFLLDFVPQIFRLNITEYIEKGKIFNDVPSLFIFSLLTNMINGVFLEKTFFFLIFLTIGLSSYYSLRFIKSEAARIISATFYVINPFVYERFLAGHIWFLLGYAILPLYLYSLLSVFDYLKSRDNKGVFNNNVILTAILGTLMIIFSIHFAIILALPAIAVFLSKIIFFNKKEIKSTLLTFAKLILWLLLFNSFWILPALFFKPAFLGNFNISHLYAFKTAPDAHFGLFPNILGLYGFWREISAPGEIVLSKNLLPYWPVFLMPIVATISIGIISLFRERKYALLCALILIAVISVLLVAGPHLWINIWLFEHFSLLRGMREMEKFSALIVLIYCFLTAQGVAFFKQRLKRNAFIIICVIIASTVFIYNYKMFWGFGGQIETFDYPLSYERLEKLKKEKGDFKILILPWHMYARYSFGNGRNIIDPARLPDSEKILVTSDIGIKGIIFHETNEGKIIGNLLRRSDDSLWNEILASLNVKYIFINKTPLDAPKSFNSDFLEHSQFFQKVSDDEIAEIFEVK